MRAPAKINLSLAVLGTRADGFHEIESLVLVVNWFDELVVSGRTGSGIELSCDVPGLPLDDANTVRRAATLLARRAGVAATARIELRKRIPAGAGLGGGSSDAAGALVALNRWWRLGLQRDQLAELGSEIGSDVPLFFYGPSSVIRGRGERVQPVELRWDGWVLIVLPALALSTAEVYRRYGPGPMEARTSIETLLHSAQLGAEALGRRLFNMLEPAAFERSPTLAHLHGRIRQLGVPHVRMTGSGAALFALFDQRDEAQRSGRRINEELGIAVRLVRPLTTERASGG